MAAVKYHRVMLVSGIDPSNLEDARRFLEQAIEWDATVARWHELSGLIYYRRGNSTEALQQLQTAIDLTPHLRIWARLGDVYDARGQPALSVAAYNMGGSYSNEGRLLVNLLKLAEEQIGNGEFTLARESIEHALTLDPDNLWVWRQLSKPPLGPTPGALQQVRKYRLSHLADPRTGRFNALAAIDLVEHEVWTVDDGLNMVRVLLVRSQPSEAMQVLRVLQEQAPHDARLGGAAAEIAAQSGDPAWAAVLWEQAANAATAPGTAWCAAAEQWSASAAWAQAQAAYTRCLNGWQDDRLALLGLQEACAQLEDARCAQESAGRLAALSVQATVAQMLDTDGDQVSLGPNLALNGGFEDRDPARPSQAHRWDVGIWDGWQHDRAAFYVDLDRRPWGGQTAAILMGFWRVKTGLPSGAYAEVIAPPIAIPAHAAYVLSFFFKTDDLRGDVFVGDGLSEAQGRTFQGITLSGTEQRWKQVVVVAANPFPQDIYLRPQLRLWGLGAVWFDDVQVNLLVSPSVVGTPLPVSVR
jgi:tetratricopeptide (TPR) repeat protein